MNPETGLFCYMVGSLLIGRDRDRFGEEDKPFAQTWRS
jgi:hypothetical protein